MSPTKEQAPSQTVLTSLFEHYQTGRYDDAEKLAISITQQFPTHQLSWKVLGAVFNQTGRISEALIASKKIVELDPQDVEAHSNLGVTLQALGRFEEAEASYRQAVTLKPDFAEAHSNLGAALQKLGRLEEAAASYGHAVALKPDYVEAHSNLGFSLQELGRLEEAEASYRQAIALKPDYAVAHNNLGVTLQELGRLEEAIEGFKQALKINPDYTQAYYNMGNALTGIGFRKPMPDLPEFICQLLEKEKFVRPKDVSKAAISLLKFDPIIIGAIKKQSSGKLFESFQETIVNLSKIPLLLKLMELCPLPDLEFEDFVKDIRSAILLSVSDINYNTEILTFQIFLALQCFTNEYLYDQTDVEVDALKELENLVENKLTNGQQPSPTELTCLASYKALHEFSWLHLLSMPAELKALQRRQIIEPEEEKRLRPKIPMLQDIKDSVSRKVQEQYEDNPYPRWVNLGLHPSPKSIAATAKELKLRISNFDINEVSTPQILIAGCGTGQHSIGTASRFKECDILAIDLSLSSLAYARRKTEELGISNIEYMQADILDLGALNRKFDIIESVGVLHHMDNPMAGWKVLTNCLKLGGLMNIGLYSELARRDIVQMRDEIEQSNIDLSDEVMKTIRKNILSSEMDHHKTILLSNDFYSLSTLRDLLFHAQEHRFTIPQIQDCLSEFGLVFCGFEAKKVIQMFKSKRLAENDVYDLEKWDDFEKENPHAFAGMYQFWCQKV